MTLEEWAVKHGVGLAALAELRAMWGDPCALGMMICPPNYTTEAHVDDLVVIEAANKGVKLWRNNVGVLPGENGRPIRFGLANDSAARNAVLKSSDRIGIRPVLIGPGHVGQTFGRFVAREIKRPGWKYSGTQREVAQLNFIKLVLSLGGDAAFASGVGTL